MSHATLSGLMAHFRALCLRQPHLPDAELLRRFAHQRDAAAFEQLLERYAPMVWGICRRILPVEAEREEVFQATFLALVHRPNAVDPSRSLGSWLHTVAVRVARKALIRTRRQRPKQVVPERATVGDVAEKVGSRELFRMMDEEIERLPTALRLPLILFCLQGRTREEATGRQVCLLGEKLSQVAAMAFSPDGKRLASGHQDGTIPVWDAAAGREIRQWRKHSYGVRAVAFSLDGKTLASGSSLESAVRFWDAASGEERRSIAENYAPLKELRFSADGRTLLAIANDQRMLWWGVKSAAVRRRFSWLSRSWGTSALSADGRILISYSARTKELFAWDVGAEKYGT